MPKHREIRQPKLTLFSLMRCVYLLTFTCYGAHPRQPYYRAMKSPSYYLDAQRRSITLDAIHHTCRHRQWILIAVHIRPTHIHIVVEADRPPEPVITEFKSYISRALNRIEPDCKRWTRHGSTRYLWTSDDITAAMHYVISQQGEPMTWWSAPRENGSLAVAAL